MTPRVHPPAFTPPPALAEKVKAAPKAPGCYLYKDSLGFVLYVGKAKVLKTRVASYFGKTAREDADMRMFLGRIADVEYRVTPSELDALMLEYRLIKQYKPWFNRQHKPDKPRPYLRIGAGGRYATLSVAAKPANDGATYYDHFTDEDDVQSAIDLLARVWQTPSCGRASFEAAPGHACLNGAMGRCMAPCRGEADEARYAAAMREIRRLFAGGSVPAQAALKTQMHTHARALAFEKAAACKETLMALGALQRKCRRRFHLPDDRDTLIFMRPYRAPMFSLFYAAKGEVAHRADFPAGADEETLAAFIGQIEAGRPTMEDRAWLADCLAEILADKLFIPLPRGAGRAALQKALHRGLAEFGA